MNETTHSIPLLDLATGKSVSTVSLDAAIRPAKNESDLIYQVEHMYRSNARQGNACTKTRGEVSGSGKKPWKQKGTGRARAGSVRSPLWIKGGTVFGPKPRDYSYVLPAKLKQRALASTLHTKALSGELFLSRNPKPVEKAKDVFGWAQKLKLKKALLVISDDQSGLARVSRNIPHFSVRLARELTAHDVLNCIELVVTESGYEVLLKRLKEQP